MFSFPKRSSSISTQLILHFWFPIFTFFFFPILHRRELHAFSMTSNKGQSLVWMRGVLGDWGTFTATKHKIGSSGGGGDKKKRGPQTVKADPLISRFCRHSETEQKNINLVCTVKLLGQTRWQTEGDWEGEIARQGGEVQSGWFAYNIQLFEWREDSFFIYFFGCLVVSLRSFCQSLPWSSGSCGGWSGTPEALRERGWLFRFVFRATAAKRFPLKVL